jgi:hypothetical protein
MSESNPLPGNRPAPAKPSKSLLDKFAVEAENLRMQAADHRVTASAAHEAHQRAAAEADEVSTRYQHALTELERIRQEVEAARAELDATLQKADEHRARGQQHQAHAEQLLADAAYLDEVVARAQILPVFAEKCTCTLPGAPDYAERRNTCPVHGAPTSPAGPAGDTKTDPPPPIESLPVVHPKSRGSRKK